MHHPIQYETMAKIQQAELLREAADRRAACDVRANTPRPVTRWLVITLSLGVLAIGLALLTGMIGAG